MQLLKKTTEKDTSFGEHLRQRQSTLKEFERMDNWIFQGVVFFDPPPSLNFCIGQNKMYVVEDKLGVFACFGVFGFSCFVFLKNRKWSTCLVASSWNWGCTLDAVLMNTAIDNATRPVEIKMIPLSHQSDSESLPIPHLFAVSTPSSVWIWDTGVIKWETTRKQVTT